VKRGDFPEPTYILELPKPICIEGDEYADPHQEFSTVHLVPSDATNRSMRALINSEIWVTVTEPMAANTGHHHAPLVAWVTEVSKSYDITTEYGTAATTVRGFYEALSAGSGDQAATFIIQDKRVGPFSPKAMTAFYGNLREPLELVSLEQKSADTFLVRYNFRSKSGWCNGRAVVSTVNRSGSNFISSIKALDGC